MISASPYALGLDLGSASLGWAIVRLGRDSVPLSIVASGVRCFDAGVEGDLEQGKDSSRAEARRLARQPRRQQWRRQQRTKSLFRLLQQLELLPNSDGIEADDRKALIDALDEQLAATHLPSGDHDAAQKLSYILRHEAATSKVEPFELGRALYHLAQRRGYLSNRKGRSDDDDLGLVESSIDSLSDEMGQSTLGSHFAKNVDPESKRWHVPRLVLNHWERLRTGERSTDRLRVNSTSG